MMIVKDVSHGLLELFLLNKLFDWLQRSFGFGRGCSGIGCGIIFLCIFLFLACNIVFGNEIGSRCGDEADLRGFRNLEGLFVWACCHAGLVVK